MKGLQAVQIMENGQWQEFYRASDVDIVVKDLMFYKNWWNRKEFIEDIFKDCAAGIAILAILGVLSGAAVTIWRLGLGFMSCG
jgi:hypothetical protein